MSATDKRKTLLERVLESPPSQLREAYEASARRSSPAHEILRLLVAGQLWNTGYRDISFEKAVSGSQGQDAYVDIYVGESNMFVECERMPTR